MTLSRLTFTTSVLTSKSHHCSWIRVYFTVLWPLLNWTWKPEWRLSPVIPTLRRLTQESHCSSRPAWAVRSVPFQHELRHETKSQKGEEETKQAKVFVIKCAFRLCEYYSSESLQRANLFLPVSSSPEPPLLLSVCCGSACGKQAV